MSEETKPTVRIENWSLNHGALADWLTGNVEDHPRFNRGTFVYTSKILSHVGDRVETLNTIYILVGPEKK